MGEFMYPIVGRECVSEVLSDYLDATLGGSGACVLLEGSVGTGKSRMLKAVAGEGAQRGLAVAHMRAGANREATVVRELYIFLRHVIAGDVPADIPESADFISPDSNPFLVADRLGEMIEEAASRRPLLIILDDAQRVDEISSVALQALVRTHAEAAVLWLLARRPTTGQSLAQHAIGWLCDRAAMRLHLGPLDDEAVSALCAGILGVKPDSSVLTWAARCGGNPWLLERLMSAFVDAGNVVIVDGKASILADRLPESMHSAVHGLMSAMPAEVGNLLVQGAQPPPDHDSAGSSQVDRPLPGDETVCLPGRRDTAKRRGLRTAVTDRRGHDSSSASADLRRVGRAGAADVTAQPLRQSPGHGLLVAEAPMSPLCECDDVAATILVALSIPSEASRSLARALRLLVGAGRSAEAGHFAAVLIRAGLDLGETDRAILKGLLRSSAERGSHESSAGGAVRPASAAGSALPFVAVVDGRIGADMPPPLRQYPDAGIRVCPSWTWVVHALIAADCFPEAEKVAEAIRQSPVHDGDSWAEAQWHGHRAELLMALGRLGEARAAAEAGLHLSDRTEPERSVLTHAVLARVSLHYGDTDTARNHLRTANRFVADDAVADRIRLDWALAQFHAASGRPRMAVQSLVDIDAETTPDPLVFSEAPTAAARIVRLARKADLGTTAERAAGLARSVADRNPEVASLAGGAEHAEGLLYRDTAALRRAVGHYYRGGRPLAAGIALEDAAQSEQEKRNAPGAVELLGSALEMYVQCDARRDVARAQKKLRKLGVSDAGGMGGNRPVSGWESLTSAELRVVRAIVDGKTNKEAANTLFLSPHTVDSHLRRVFGKLGINTRVELTKYFLTHEVA
ncbi:helix-turn-helix transcriptional regulator [Actinoplanes xinjiangensis]|uniref:AAA ATPase-like protein n=1 Tax=Actinoplanes xinjiangensis TaxID=512350 RepID=A0A316ETI2_9ACTN|nr:LuxR C-terminal-related transcriptional regulator [Actinoplanes xinjiangensis]PWK36037.1 AAA ATPase-like protein [Actinoplanes xinjiangensis]GIF42964.1 hypothetical protein Axi01nite_72750 [Actinoplanes xinjiangensis]